MATHSQDMPGTSSPRARARHAETFDPLDCYNADLVWILDKLVSRTGGQFGLISRHLGAAEQPEVLAYSSSLTEADRPLLGQLATHASQCVDLRAPFGDDDPAISHSAHPAGPDVEDIRGLKLLHLTFSPAEGVTLIATVCRNAGAFTISLFDGLNANRLYPVLSRYIRLWWLHRLERRRANSLTVALDLSDVGVVLLSGRATLVFANSRAHTFFQKDDALQVQGELIGARDAQANVRLQAAIQNAVYRNSLAVPDDGERQRSPILTLPRASKQRPLIATVMHVGRPAVDARDPSVILYFVDPEQSVEHLLAPACAMYKLTAVESRLVHHLVRGLRINDAAQTMQIQPDTARSYLRQIFLKTSTHRQAELMRVMLTTLTRTNSHIDTTLL